jgi:hypothetical protein
MSTKSREVIWGGRIMGAEIRARQAREEAQKTDDAGRHPQTQCCFPPENAAQDRRGPVKHGRCD